MFTSYVDTPYTSQSCRVRIIKSKIRSMSRIIIGCPGMILDCCGLSWDGPDQLTSIVMNTLSPLALAYRDIQCTYMYMYCI